MYNRNGNNQYGGRPTKEEFNKKLENRDIKYRLVDEYPKNNTIRVLFSCPEEHHDDFYATPDKILQKQNCPECLGKPYRHTLESLNKKILKFKLNYVCLKYNGYNEDCEFYCNEHKHYFTCRPDNLFEGKPSCEYCIKNIYRDINSYNLYLQENNRNIVCLEFITMNKKTKHRCMICNHEWKVLPGNIVYRNTGCPCCAKYGFDSSKSGIVYYIKITHDNNIYYKIGITNKTIEERFKKCEMKRIEKLFTIYFENGNDAYNYEQNLLKEYVDYRYSGKPILKSGGNTEIFIKDIFEGNYEQINYI